MLSSRLPTDAETGSPRLKADDDPSDETFVSLHIHRSTQQLVCRVLGIRRSSTGKTPQAVAMASSMLSDSLGRSASRNEEGNGSDQSPATEGNGDNAAQPTGTTTANSSVPKPKRLACMICRKRKLKCDGVKPSCSTCTRLGHTCAYDEVRRKSGPKRGYVKALEERLSEQRPASSILSSMADAMLTIYCCKYRNGRIAAAHA